MALGAPGSWRVVSSNNKKGRLCPLLEVATSSGFKVNPFWAKNEEQQLQTPLGGLIFDPIFSWNLILHDMSASMPLY